MSRRYRVELIRNKALQSAADETETKDQLQVQKEKISNPLIWNRLASGFRIQDLKPNYYDEIISMFKNYFIQEEVLCRNVELEEDLISVECFVRLLVADMKGATSIVLIDERDSDNEILAGVLILKLFLKEDFTDVFNRAQIIEGDAFKTCRDLLYFINRKCDIFERMNCDRYFNFGPICLKPEYRHKGTGFGLHLMKCGLNVAKSMNTEIVSGMFTNFTLQETAKKIGMETLFEVNYVQWRHAETKQMYFSDPGAGNYSCCLMAGKLPDVLPKRVIELPKPPPPPVKKPKETRAEKRLNR